KADMRRALAISYDLCGDGWLHCGKLDKAEHYYGLARPVLVGLLDEDPSLELYKYLLANNHYRLGTVAIVAGHRRLAAHHFREALQPHLSLARKDPDRTIVAALLARCGEPEKASAMADRISKSAAANPETLYSLACGYALCAAAVGNDHPLFGGYVKQA